MDGTADAIFCSYHRKDRHRGLVVSTDQLQFIFAVCNSIHIHINTDVPYAFRSSVSVMILVLDGIIFDLNEIRQSQSAHKLSAINEEQRDQK